MTCPYCGFQGERRLLHAHLAEQHVDAVELDLDEASRQLYYRLACPTCSFSFRKTVRPRSTDTSFLREFRREIGLVAFDLLLYHLEGVHEDLEPEAAGGDAVVHIPLVQE